MTFLNLALLSGAGLIVIPVILHLLMRQKPKLLEFPALRFIQKRHDTNQRRLRLRHLLLLLLRAGAIALLALALARPSIKFSSRLGSQESPVAAALIFDAAPHMQYRREKKTRLEAAQEIGQWLLAQLPPESQIAVFDSGMSPRSFDVDRGLSKQRIEKLEVVPNPRSLNQIVGEAAQVLKDSKLPAKEIYVFTDLSRASWRADETAKLQDRLHELPGVALYLIDVGVSEPSNFSLGDLHLSQQVVAAGGSVEIQTDISSLGVEGERTIELDLLTSAGTLQNISAADPSARSRGDSQTVDFQLTSLKPGTQQGLVRIVGQDSLAADDVRYFSVEVRPPWPVLVVAQQPTAETALYLTEAIAPAEMRKRHDARFDCTVIGYSELANQTLKKLDKVCGRLPAGSAGPGAGRLATPDRLCRRGARRGNLSRPPRASRSRHSTRPPHSSFCRARSGSKCLARKAIRTWRRRTISTRSSNRLRRIRRGPRGTSSPSIVTGESTIWPRTQAR